MGAWGSFFYIPTYGASGTSEALIFATGLTSADSELLSGRTHRQATTNVHGLVFTGPGSGGGLDADKLDGYHASTFATCASLSAHGTQHASGGSDAIVLVAAAASASNADKLDGLHAAALTATHTMDYVGIGSSNVVVYRTSNYTFYSQDTSGGNIKVGNATQSSLPEDLPVFGFDFDGDGLAEYAVWRPSTGVWYWYSNATSAFQSMQWGTAASPYYDIPGGPTILYHWQLLTLSGDDHPQYILANGTRAFTGVVSAGNWLQLIDTGSGNGKFQIANIGALDADNFYFRNKAGTSILLTMTPGTSGVLVSGSLSASTIYGSLQSKLDDLLSPDDNTDLNVTSGAHGLTPKFPGNTTTFFRGDGTYTIPPKYRKAIIPAPSMESRPTPTSAWMAFAQTQGTNFDYGQLDAPSGNDTKAFTPSIKLGSWNNTAMTGTIGWKTSTTSASPAGVVFSISAVGLSAGKAFDSALTDMSSAAVSAGATAAALNLSTFIFTPATSVILSGDDTIWQLTRKSRTASGAVGDTLLNTVSVLFFTLEWTEV